MSKYFFTGAYDDNSLGLLRISDSLQMEWKCLAQDTSCSYVSFDPNRNLLYTFSRKGTQEYLLVFTWDGENVTKTSELSLQTTGACHITHTANLIILSLYGSGSVELFGLDIHGLPLENRHICIKHEGQGIRPQQDHAHTHWAGLFEEDATHTDFFCIDLGTDTVTLYRYHNNAVPGIEVLHIEKMPAGSGPRHAVLDSKKQNLYVLSELSSELYRIVISSQPWETKRIDGTRGSNYDAENDSWGGAIKFSDDENLIICSNRGDETLACFCRSQNLKLWPMLKSQRNHKHVRDLCYFRMENCEYVLCANMISSTISIWEIDREKEILVERNEEMVLHKVSCILPLA